MCQNCVNATNATMMTPDEIVMSIRDIAKEINQFALSEDAQFKVGVLMTLVAVNDTLVNLCLRGGDIDAAAHHASTMLALGEALKPYTASK